jgi:hypothetical protein
VDTCLFAALVTSAIVGDYAIASFAGAVMAMIAAIINLLSCYRLRDFDTVFRLLWTCWCCCPRPSIVNAKNNTPIVTRWLIKQRLMAISMAVCILNTVIFICLTLRGVFDDTASGVQASEGRYALISEHIFRWAYLGILAVYFSLIDYNTKQRLLARESRRMHEEEYVPTNTNTNVAAEPNAQQQQNQLQQPFRDPPLLAIKKPTKTVTFAASPLPVRRGSSRVSNNRLDEDDNDNEDDDWEDEDNFSPLEEETVQVA